MTQLTCTRFEQRRFQSCLVGYSDPLSQADRTIVGRSPSLVVDEEVDESES